MASRAVSISTSASARSAPQPLAHLDAVQPGQHEVEHDQVGRSRRAGVEGGVAVPGHADPQALVLQRPPQGRRDRLVVVDDEHVRVGRSHAGQRAGHRHRAHSG